VSTNQSDANPSAPRRCVFFDRDGVVNEWPGPGNYVTSWDNFRFLPEFAPVLKLVTQRGYAAIIVTNQRGVARGIMSLDTVQDMHRRLRDLLQNNYGLRVLDILVCPHEKNSCSCRKPAPGMLLDAARAHRIDLAASWMVGDSAKDVEAGRRAGCHTVLLGNREQAEQADHHVANLAELHALLARVLVEHKT